MWMCGVAPAVGSNTMYWSVDKEESGFNTIVLALRPFALLGIDSIELPSANFNNESGNSIEPSFLKVQVPSVVVMITFPPAVPPFEAIKEISPPVLAP